MDLSPPPGRAAAAGAAQAALRRLGTGRGGVLVFDGARGTGKTRMLAETVALARRAGMTTATGRATGLDRAAPLATLTGVLAGCPLLAPWPDDRAGPARDRLLLSDLAGRLGAVRPDRPLLIGVDDVHLADELTAHGLPTLTAASGAVLWVLAAGPAGTRGPARDAVDALVGDGADRVVLDDLSDEDVAGLCARAAGAPPGDDLAELLAGAGGNPFLCQELLRCLSAAGRVRVVDGRVRLVEAGPLPPRFCDRVGAWLGDLPDSARRLLEAGAVLGRPFTVHEVAGLTGRSAVELAGAAQDADAAGMLRATGAELDFRHRLVRDAVYAGLGEPVRAALHREAAGVVRQEGRGAAEAADHLLRSGHPGAAQAVGVLREAVRRRAARSPAEAADLAMRALDLTPPDGSDDGTRSVTELTVEAMRLLTLSGRASRARALGERALPAAPDAETETRLLTGLADALRHLGDDAVLVEHTRRALARPGVTDPLRAELLALQAYGLMSGGAADDAECAAAQAEELGRLTGRDGARVLGGIAASVAASARGDYTRALAAAREAVAVADAAGPRERQRHPRLWLVRPLIGLDRFADAGTVLDLAEQEAAELGTTWSGPLWCLHRAQLRLSAGRLREAAEDASEGLRRLPGPEPGPLALPLLTLLAETQIRGDDLAAAHRTLRRAGRVSGLNGDHGGHLAWRRLLFQEAAGRHEEACRTAVGLCTAPPARSSLIKGCPLVAGTLVRLTARCGDGRHARALVAALREQAAGLPGVAWPSAVAAHGHGLVTGAPDDLAEAVELYRWTERPFARAAALEDAAAAERAAGSAARAQALLEEAAETWYAGGAVRDADRVRKLLTDAASPGVAPAPAPRPAAPAAAPPVVPVAPDGPVLTRSERRVARLVADGLTNRQIASRLRISPHTVDTHVRNSFRKFGVTNRVEMTREFLAWERTQGT
ncbi:helix-turn-helix transcriptional regulator [Actinomadura flavalba]|uniref:helix-turn-helix transcriptional regulator n=1 Tax=Actinomadura flavalba TaxID=1120938 RepID=UPI00036826F1|nr:LuxR family transcriptional regulator [Actinomadura flavalba]